VRTTRILVLIGALLLPLTSSATGVHAQVGGVSITTPYPAVAVEPGETTTFSLEVTAPTEQRVDLAVSQVPKGWDATLRGGGFIIDSVMTDRREPPDIHLARGARSAHGAQPSRG
jgi:hypothetical protein